MLLLIDWIGCSQFAPAVRHGHRTGANGDRPIKPAASTWDEYTADSSQHKKMRVQAIVGALPTNFAREIGYAVDVPRDFWGIHQWPFENWFPDNAEDQKLVRENAAMIELIWNLGQVQIPAMVESDLSQPPDPWPRIERAIYGFRDLVRQRESGNRELRDGERDRKHRADAEQRFAQAEARRGETRK
jgi:hypothetical protein